jgi:hypothetical protein
LAALRATMRGAKAQSKKDSMHLQGVVLAKLKNNKLFFFWRAFP